MIKIAVVENEVSDRMLLINYLEQYYKEYPQEYEILSYGDGAEIKIEELESVDVIFMDIDMEEMNGLEAARRIRQSNQEILLIFVTNMAAYAIDGYSVQALDFLVKPVSSFRLEAEMKRIEQVIRRKRPNLIPIRFNDTLYQIEIHKILYIETYGRKLRIHTTESLIDTNSTIAYYEELLEGYPFFRVHSSYLVNMEHVYSMEGNTIIIHGEQVIVSRQKKKAFITALTKYAGTQL